ncbi:MAG TPA: TrmH family RNA methyltransferase [Candidatus Moranbacteria bacterium]|nr:TrmH family RNA methyltransferase [Candidatus Moranbacteria bacterium]
MKNRNELCLILHDIRSAYNVGAIMRTADGAGVKKIYLTGYTPAPYSKKSPYATQAQRQISKTALGAEESVLWEKEEKILKLIDKLRKKKISIIALEQSKKSFNFRKAKYKFPCALILGNETEGIEKEILKKCDFVVDIPMRGKKESLNVSVSAGIAIYEITK